MFFARVVDCFEEGNKQRFSAYFIEKEGGNVISSKGKHVEAAEGSGISLRHE